MLETAVPGRHDDPRISPLKARSTPNHCDTHMGVILPHGEPLLHTKLPPSDKVPCKLCTVELLYSDTRPDHKKIISDTISLPQTLSLGCPSSFLLSRSCAPWRTLPLPGHCWNQLWTSINSKDKSAFNECSETYAFLFIPKEQSWTSPTSEGLFYRNV